MIQRIPTQSTKFYRFIESKTFIVSMYVAIISIWIYANLENFA